MTEIDIVICVDRTHYYYNLTCLQCVGFTKTPLLLIQDVFQAKDNALHAYGICFYLIIKKTFGLRDLLYKKVFMGTFYKTLSMGNYHFLLGFVVNFITPNTGNKSV